MPRQMISDHQWAKLVPILRILCVHVSLGTRSFIEAVLWKLRTGAPWRELPEGFLHPAKLFTRAGAKKQIIGILEDHHEDDIPAPNVHPDYSKSSIHNRFSVDRLTMVNNGPLALAGSGPLFYFDSDKKPLLNDHVSSAY